MNQSAPSSIPGLDSAAPTPTARRAAALAFPAALAGIWIVMAVLIRPVGDFPLNDDWSYGKIVRTLVETGRLEYTPWVSMALLTQVLWAALFCLPFGFSHTALRFSTLTLGLAGILGTYCLLRECRLRRSTAFLGALTVAVNPVFFNLSATFMTDVPFFAFAVLSAWLLARALRRGNVPLAAGGIALACCATLIREVGMIIPFAFALAWTFGLRIGDWGLRISKSPIPNSQSAIRNPQSEIEKSPIPNPQSSIPNPRSEIEQSAIRNPQSEIEKSPIPNPQSSIPNPRSEIEQSAIRNPQSEIEQSAIRNPQSAIPMAVVACAVLFPLACHLVFHAWLVHQGLPALYNQPRDRLLESLTSPRAPLVAAKWSMIQTVTVGFYLLPFLVARIPHVFSRRRTDAPKKEMLNDECGMMNNGLPDRGTNPVHHSSFCIHRFLSVGFWAVLLGVAVLAGSRRGVPISIKPGNILYDFGLGPGLLRDIYCLGLPHLPTAPKLLWLAATVAAVGAAAVLVQAVLSAAWTIWKNRNDGAERGIPLFLLTASAGFFLPFALGPVEFDRYYLMQLPLLLCIVGLTSPDAEAVGCRLEAVGKNRNLCGTHGLQPKAYSLQPTAYSLSTVAAALLFLLYGLFSVAGMRDCLEWNRVKWKALEDLTQVERISPREIDGGFEFNGLHTYDPKTCPTDPRLWMKDDTPYVVAFGPIPGYEEWKRYPYRRLLPPREDHILILRRANGRMNEE